MAKADKKKPKEKEAKAKKKPKKIEVAVEPAPHVSPLAPDRFPDLPEIAGVRFATVEAAIKATRVVTM